MKKLILQIIFVFSLVLSSTSTASAWILAKLSNMAEDVTTTVTKAGKQAQNILDKAGNLTIVQKIGKGFTEARSWIESNVGNLKSFADEVQSDVEAYKKMYEEGKGIYDKHVGAYSKIADDLKAIGKQYDSIKMKIKEVETSFMAEVEAQKSTISGQIESCNQNMTNLQKLIQEKSTDKDAYKAEYEQWKYKCKELSRQLSNLDETAKAELDKMLNSYKTELSNLDTQIAKLQDDMKFLTGLSTEPSSEDALTSTSRLYFLQYDEELNPQRQDTIRYNRLLERRNSIISAYEEALKQLPDINEKNNSAEDIGYNASTFDTTAGAWGAAAQLQIENLKALSAYTHLLIQDLKRQTAIELSNLTFYKLQKEQTNITEFNMDDYVYKKKGDK